MGEKMEGGEEGRRRSHAEEVRDLLGEGAGARELHDGDSERTQG